MPALNYDDDTEFNDALRKHGIIPQREQASRTPSPEPTRTPSPDLSDPELDDDLISREVLERFRAQRVDEAKVAQGNRKFGRMYPIGKTDYKKEVTDSSKDDLEGEPEGSGTGVICYLFKDYLPECKLLKPLLDRMAALYPSSKFCSIVSDHCIENYPDKNCPTLLIYRKGEMMGQVVGLGGMGGDKVTFIDVERMLFAFRGIDFALKIDPSSVGGGGSQFASKSAHKKATSSDEDDNSDDDPTFVGGGRKSGIRQSARRKDESDDDDYDL